MKELKIYTDGACKTSTKQGGIGVVWVMNGEKVYEYSKTYSNVTNNKMELIAIGFALKSIKEPVDSLTIVSDSKYALGCIFNESWKPKKNVALIAIIREDLQRVKSLIGEVKVEHTYGHQKDDTENTKWNNLADSLASEASKVICVG